MTTDKIELYFEGSTVALGLARTGLEPATSGLWGQATPLTLFVFTYIYMTYKEEMSSKVKW